MPTATVNGAEIYYEIYGSGEETIVFSHGLLFSGSMFEEQVDALKDRFRCITYDHRGQGKSQVTDTGYDIDSLTADAISLIEILGAAPCHFAGLSTGGFVALRLGIRRPDLVRSLILIETSAGPEPRHNIPRYRLLGFVARWLGLGLVVKRVMAIMFGAAFLNDPARTEVRERWQTHLMNVDRIGAARALAGVIEREGVAHQLNQINVPTLVIVGSDDAPTPPEEAENMHSLIPESQLIVIPKAGHTSTIEEPIAVNEATNQFLSNLS